MKALSEILYLESALTLLVRQEEATVQRYNFGIASVLDVTLIMAQPQIKGGNWIEMMI